MRSNHTSDSPDRPRGARLARPAPQQLRFSRTALVGGPVAALLLCRVAAAAGAEPAIAVVPAGSGEGFAPAVQVAGAVVDELNRKQANQARLAYPRPRIPKEAIERKSADDLLAAAFRSFKDLDFASVQEDANQALQLYKKLVKAGVDERGYLETLHLLAAAALFDGDADGAFKAMNDAVVFRRTPPSPRLFNPTVQQLYRKVAAKPADEHQGFVRVDVADALLWLNGELHGAAQGLLPLRAGLYLVQVDRPGDPPWQRWFRVKPSHTRDLAARIPGNTRPTVPALIESLRSELDAQRPGTAVARARERFDATEVIIIAESTPCRSQRCTLRMRWAAADEWKRRGSAIFAGDSSRAGTDLLAGELPRDIIESVDGIRACTADSQCSVNERCRDGRCQRPRSIVRKWWFWTAIGVAATTVVTAIALPLAWPDAPVIEVR